jgi:uncharacterized surface protein with fasciclin (FAS1) repeats
MKTLKVALAMVLALSIPAAAIAGGCGGSKSAQASYSQQEDIIDTAVDAGSFNTLAAALSAAGLVDALKGDGPYTVFAPTDEAFAKLPEGTVEELLKPENKEMLTRVLTYHVVPGKVTAAQVAHLENAEALSGDRLSIAANGKGVLIDDAKVIQADVEASNGVIHVIDTVLIPN